MQSAESVAKNEIKQEPVADSELGDKTWAVMSFERVEGRDLTYAEALEMMNQLDINDVTGLCIVTNDAAERLTT